MEVAGISQLELEVEMEMGMVVVSCKFLEEVMVKKVVVVMAVNWNHKEMVVVVERS